MCKYDQQRKIKILESFYQFLLTVHLHLDSLITIIMEQQKRAIQKLHTRAAKIQNTLDNYMLRFQEVPFQSNPSNSEKYQSYHNYANVKVSPHMPTTPLKGPSKIMDSKDQTLQILAQHEDDYNREELQVTKKQIQHILKQYQILLSKSQSTSNRYIILRQSRKEIYQQITSLKAQLQKNKQNIQKYKKLKSQLTKIQQQLQIESISVNKLQNALNSSLKLQYQIKQKLKIIENKQFTVIGKLEKEKQTEMEISIYWKDYEKWNKLMQHRKNIQKQIQYHNEQNQKQYKEKENSKQLIQQKISNINQVFDELNVIVTQQEYIISQIMVKQQITGYQIFNQVRQEYGDQYPAKQQQIQQINQKIAIFKKQIGVQKGNEAIRDSKIKNKTQPVHKQQANQMRMTAKIPQYHLRRKDDTNLSEHSNYKKRKSLPNNSTPNMPPNNSQLPKINPQQYSKSPRSNSMVPITHKNEATKYMSNTKRSNYDTMSHKFRSSSGNIISKTLIHDKSEDEERFSELRRNIRVRTKEGYKYYNNSGRYVGSQQPEQLWDNNKSQYNVNVKDNKEKSDIIKIYDRIANRKQLQKDNYQLQKESEMTQRAKDKQKQQISSLSNHIKLQLSKKRKRSKPLQKQQMESRESDNQSDQKSTIRNSMKVSLKQAKVQNKKQKKNSTQKNIEEVQSSTNVQRRLNTIDEKQEEQNLHTSHK